MAYLKWQESSWCHWEHRHNRLILCLNIWIRGWTTHKARAKHRGTFCGAFGRGLIPFLEAGAKSVSPSSDDTFWEMGLRLSWQMQCFSGKNLSPQYSYIQIVLVFILAAGPALWDAPERPFCSRGSLRHGRSVRTCRQLSSSGFFTFASRCSSGSPGATRWGCESEQSRN